MFPRPPAARTDTDPAFGRSSRTRHPATREFVTSRSSNPTPSQSNIDRFPTLHRSHRSSVTPAGDARVDVAGTGLVGVLAPAGARPLEAEGGRAGGFVLVLGGVSRDRCPRRAPAGRVDEYVGRRLALLALVALDVAAGDLEVAH